jgi:uncharacterized membrane protein
MAIHQALYELAGLHDLDPPNLYKLQALAGLHQEPARVTWWVARASAVLAAANWGLLGRYFRFALLEGFVVVMAIGALKPSSARVPLLLLAFLGIGALFAYFGQTYQTGADPWQLFALWAGLGLPLCLALRSDVLWSPWALVVVTGISLWTYAHTGQRWFAEHSALAPHIVAQGATLLVMLLLSPMLRRWTGAKIWSLRTVVTLVVVSSTLSALGGLFHSQVAAHYWLGLVVLGATAAAFSTRRGLDVFALSAVALGINVLLVAGLGRALFMGSMHSDFIGAVLILGLGAAGLLAASVNLVLRTVRRHEGDSA